MVENHEEGLTLLGRQVGQPQTPEEAILECIPWDGGSVEITLDCPEVTALCPKTGQPDFAQFVIEYEPDQLLIESKALKLYLGSFRNVGTFHERFVQRVADDLFDAMAPKWLVVTGNFMPRGGISICPVAKRGDVPSTYVSRVKR